MNNFFGLTAEDAKYLLTGFGLLVTIAVSWLPTLKISDYTKFGLVALLSLVGGFLTVVATDQFVNTGSLIQNGAVVLTAAQVFYYGAFRILGLEKVMFPRQALTTEAKEQAKEQVPVGVSSERAKDLLDPATPSELKVTTEIINTPSK